MNTEDNRPISLPPIHGHGVIGDRRTGAMVAADGTINWFCVPNFDSPPLFGTLLDPEDRDSTGLRTQRRRSDRTHRVRSQSISGNGNAMITEEVRKFPTRK
jgi:GH15 family glucan-1,4-alpha-glucosidase